ncbi:MAG: hypothetical protein Q4A03_02380 [Rothia sp. (in: high G+C Gram-positive bacteria)]|nr:hypothetical protein [Rothia sp. (in: high G+C Gram-positive bacteria)]
MSATIQDTYRVPARVRTRNSRFSEEKLQARQDYHLKKIEQTLSKEPPSVDKRTRFKLVKKYFGFA